ncbi:MAG: plastocyanin/azurin family copper-binding protein [Gemmatimonadota bacterium]
MSFHRFLGAAAAIFVLAGCGRGEQSAADSTAMMALPSVSALPETGAMAPDASAPALIDVIPGTAAPITGAIIEVKMIGDAKGFRFEPSHVTAKSGDAVKFVLISGGPHEIAFDLDQVPSQSRSQLQINMPNSTDGKSPLLSGAKETWTVSLGALKPGRYPFVSTPRLPQGMKGEIEIQ